VRSNKLPLDVSVSRLAQAWHRAVWTATCFYLTFLCRGRRRPSTEQRLASTCFFCVKVGAGLAQNSLNSNMLLLDVSVSRLAQAWHRPGTEQSEQQHASTWFFCVEVGTGLAQNGLNRNMLLLDVSMSRLALAWHRAVWTATCFYLTFLCRGWRRPGTERSEQQHAFSWRFCVEVAQAWPRTVWTETCFYLTFLCRNWRRPGTEQSKQQHASTWRFCVKIGAGLAQSSRRLLEGALKTTLNRTVGGCLRAH